MIFNDLCFKDNNHSCQMHFMHTVFIIWCCRMYLFSNKHFLIKSQFVFFHVCKVTHVHTKAKTTDYICKSKPLFVVKSEYLHSFVFFVQCSSCTSAKLIHKQILTTRLVQLPVHTMGSGHSVMTTALGFISVRSLREQQLFLNAPQHLNFRSL